MVEQSPEGLTKHVQKLKRRGEVSGKSWLATLVSRLSFLLFMTSLFFTVTVLTFLAAYDNYHHVECAQLYEPFSEITVGSILVLRKCPHPYQELEDPLVESFSDGDEPDA